LQRREIFEGNTTEPTFYPKEKFEAPCLFFLAGRDYLNCLSEGGAIAAEALSRFSPLVFHEAFYEARLTRREDGETGASGSESMCLAENRAERRRGGMVVGCW